MVPEEIGVEEGAAVGTVLAGAVGAVVAAGLQAARSRQMVRRRGGKGLRFIVYSS